MQTMQSYKFYQRKKKINYLNKI